MQAPQSSTASGIPAADPNLNLNLNLNLKPDPKPDPAFTRGFPSPFSAPILAARKYFERQRGESWQPGGQDTDAARSAISKAAATQTRTALNGDSLSGDSLNGDSNGDSDRDLHGDLHGATARGDDSSASSPGSRDELRLQELRREQDRRLERSLYEGHALEAGLDLAAGQTETGRTGTGQIGEAGRMGDAGGASESGPAVTESVSSTDSRTESDGSEPFFPYASSGPAPDPEAVRGAILRLSRGPERRLAAWTPAGEANRAGASATASQTAAAQTAAASAVAAKTAAAGSAGSVRSGGPGGPAQPPSFGDVFGDVARRVWAAHSEAAGLEAPVSAEQGRARPDAPTGSLAALAVEKTQVTEVGSTAAVRSRTQNDAEIRLRDEAGDDAEVEARAEIPASAGDRNRHPGAISDAFVRQDGLMSAGVEVSGPDAGYGSPRVSPRESPAGPSCGAQGCGAGDGPALAHDACNLLSALALYSELLASPGVLGEQHRHYAEELKLMAGRSQVLIDRLLRGTAAVEAVETTIAPEGGKIAGAAARTAGEAAGRPGSSAAAISDSTLSRQSAPHALRNTGAADENGAAETSAETSAETGAETGAATVPEKLLQPSPDSLIAAPAYPSGAAATIPRSAASTDGTGAADTGTADTGTADTAPSAVDNSTPGAGTGEAEATSLVYLLMRWGSLLSTLAHGSLEVVFGPHAATPVPAGVEALERILVNLVRNARAATAEGGAIRIGVGTESAAPEEFAEEVWKVEDGEGRVGAATNQQPADRQIMVLTVDDSGCGMTGEQVRRILGLENVPAGHGTSRSGHAATGQTPRRGLGLQIVRQLVASSGGTLSIESWPGRGTRVAIRWPVAIRPSAKTSVAPGTHPVTDLVRDAGPQAGPAILSSARACPETQPAASPPGKAVAASAAPDASPIAAAHAGPIAGLAAEPVIRLVAQPVTRPVELAAARPIAGGAAEALPQTTYAAGAAGEAVGPDGFSEAELRAMMLRLHRTAPHERTPLGRSLGDWRRPNARQAGSLESEEGFGVPGAVARGLDSGPGRAGQSSAGHQESAAKGAIAC